jgi:hypothetical protein
MVFLLAFNVLQKRFKLARADRKGAVAALPVEALIIGGKAFDPSRRFLLQTFNHIGLGESSRQCSYQMDMIGHTADAKNVRASLPANSRHVGVHPGPNCGVQPWVALFCAEDDVDNDLAKRLRHGGSIAEEALRMNRAFSADLCVYIVPGALPQAGYETAPLALNSARSKPPLWRASRPSAASLR